VTSGNPPVSIDRAEPAASAPTSCPNVLALLFDELSFTYLHDGDEVRPEFPALRRLSSQSVNYLNARAPAAETLVSLPGYLAARHVESVRVDGMRLLEVTATGTPVAYDVSGADSLSSAARGAGYRTEMAGYYLPYCHLLGELADTCRSLSFYNASTADESFSPLHPLMTTLIMWPRQFPFGLVKNLAFAPLQRRLVATLAEFARRPFPPGRPVFRFVHFSVPHLPFVFTADGYHPPFNPLRTSPDDGYVQQLHYVDRLVGDIVSDMERAGTFDGAVVVVLADHGFRFGGGERDPLHIPFIVKQPRQSTRADVREVRRGELLLREVVRGSCGPYSQ
jgi:hypothetical protein